MSRRIAYLAYTLLGLLTASALNGCENGFVGTINLDIAGVPMAGIQNVVLAIKGVQLGGDGGRTDFEFGTEKQVDVDAGNVRVLQGVLIPVGDYKWVRLEINPADSFVIASNGDRYALNVSSAYQTTKQFTVGEGQIAPMFVVMDLRKLLSFETHDGVRVYTLQSNARLVDQRSAGIITGSIPISFMVGSLPINDPQCDPEVYAYAGDGVVPQGFFVPVTGGTAPFASSSLALHIGRGIYTFNVGLLPPGTYTVTITCTAADIPGSRSIAFSPTQTAVVSPGGDTSVTF